jgi:hypothetical protein
MRAFRVGVVAVLVSLCVVACDDDEPLRGTIVPPVSNTPTSLVPIDPATTKS